MKSGDSLNFKFQEFHIYLFTQEYGKWPFLMLRLVINISFLYTTRIDLNVGSVDFQL